MPKKTKEQLNNAIRIGSYGELLVQSFLAEHCQFVYPTCYGHPADLIVEMGNNSLFKIQVKSRNRGREGKYAFPLENHRNQAESHRTYHCDILCFVFLPSKRFIFKPNTTQQKYYVFTDKHISEGVELTSFQETLEALASVPTINSLFPE